MAIMPAKPPRVNTTMIHPARWSLGAAFPLPGYLVHSVRESWVAGCVSSTPKRGFAQMILQRSIRVNKRDKWEELIAPEKQLDSLMIRAGIPPRRRYQPLFGGAPTNIQVVEREWENPWDPSLPAPGNSANSFDEWFVELPIQLLKCGPGGTKQRSSSRSGHLLPSLPPGCWTRLQSLLVTFWAPQGWPNMRGQTCCCLVSIVDEAGGYDDPSLCCYRSATPEKPPTKGQPSRVLTTPSFWW